MHTHKISRSILVMLPACAALLAGRGAPVAAQSALGVPFVGNNHLSYYATQLSRDGVGTPMATLHGGRYARRLGPAAARSHLSLGLQVAGRALSGPTDGVLDASVSAAWSRRLDEISDHLSVAGSVGAGALAWGVSNNDVGLLHASVPASVGVAWDLHIGGATLTPFVAPALARYSTRHYVDGVRVSREDGWDARVASGASLQIKQLLLTAGGIHGEHGLPMTRRWTFSAGVSF